MEATFSYADTTEAAGFENPERGLSVLNPTPVTSTSQIQQQITPTHPAISKNGTPTTSSSSARQSISTPASGQVAIPALTAPSTNSLPPPPPPPPLPPPTIAALRPGVPPLHIPAYTRINSIPQPVSMSSLSRLPSLPSIHPPNLSMVVPHPTTSMGYPPFSFAGFDPTYGSSSGYMQALGLGPPYQLYGAVRGISTNSTGSGVAPERTDSKLGPEAMVPVQTLSNLAALDPTHLLSPRLLHHPGAPPILHPPPPPVPHPIISRASPHLSFLPPTSTSLPVQFSNGMIPHPIPYPPPYHLYRPPHMTEAILSPTSFAAYHATPAGPPLPQTSSSSSSSSSSTSSSSSSTSSALDSVRFYQNLKLLSSSSPRLLALPCDSHSQSPSFVTSMQFAHILYRREKRKLEGVTGTKRHKHKSRQLHAARRMRGQGGRFLTKAEKEKMARQQAAITAQANAQTAGLQTKS